MQTKTFDAALVRFIADGAQLQSSRSLVLLRAIQHTVSTNELLERIFSAVSDEARRAAQDIAEAPAGARKVIDLDGSTITNMESAVDFLEEGIHILSSKRTSAENDRVLKADDGVVESFDQAIDALCDACEHLNELKWAIMENDADLSPVVPGGPFSDVDDFLASLRG